MRLTKIIALFALIVFNSCEKTEDVAQVNTLDITNVTSHSATVRGNITAEGSIAIIARGFCWSKNPEPELHNPYTKFVSDTEGAGSISWEIKQLNADVTYFVRAFYITSKDTVYGNQLEFATQDYIQFNPEVSYGTVTDIDGNVYKTVTIGSQTWMAENLRTTRYQNGDPILNEKDPKFWTLQGYNPGAYCYFEHNKTKAGIYGAYYNWYAANDARNIAPAGWRVATEEDWEELKAYCYQRIGQNYGYSLREPTTAHWQASNWVSFNETGFTALGADKAYTSTDSKWVKGNYGFFWTSSGSADLPVHAQLNEVVDLTPSQPNFGFSIRCVKN